MTERQTDRGEGSTLPRYLLLLCWSFLSWVLYGRVRTCFVVSCCCASFARLLCLCGCARRRRVAMKVSSTTRSDRPFSHFRRTINSVTSRVINFVTISANSLHLSPGSHMNHETRRDLEDDLQDENEDRLAVLGRSFCLSVCWNGGIHRSIKREAREREREREEGEG